MNVVVCLGTKETLAGPYGLGHAIIQAITSPTPLASVLCELEPQSSGLFYTQTEKHLTVVPGVPSLFIGVQKEVSERAKALATHLHEKISKEGTSAPFFMYGYSRGCLVLLKALQQLEQQLSKEQQTQLQIHLFLNDPVPGGVHLSTQEKRLPTFVRAVDIIYLKHEQRVFHEELRGIHGSSLATKTTVSFLDGNHTSATRVPYSESDLQAHSIDLITQKVAEKLRGLKIPCTLQVFITPQKDRPLLTRAMAAGFAAPEDNSLYIKSASTLRHDSSFFVKYSPPSVRFVPRGDLQHYQDLISYGFDTHLASIESTINKTLESTSPDDEDIASKNLKKLILVCQRMRELRQHIEMAQNPDNRLLITQNFKKCIEALSNLTTQVSQSKLQLEDLEQLITPLKTIATEAKHHRFINRQALLICKIIVSLILPPIGVLFAYQGLFNNKTKTTLLAENAIKESNYLEPNIKTSP